MDMTWDRTPGLRGERPATNRLSHGTAIIIISVVVVAVVFVVGITYSIYWLATNWTTV
jgi:hypothetical protein